MPTGKNLKKLLSITLAGMMTMSVVLPAASVFAEDMYVSGGAVMRVTQSGIDIPVGAEFEGTPITDISCYGLRAYPTEELIVDVTGRESSPKIDVEVVWDDLKFTYDFGTVSKYEWDIRELEYNPVYKYENGKGPAWNKEYINFTFTNRSNRDVLTGLSFTGNSDTDIYDEVTLTPEKDEVELVSAVGRTEEELHSETIKLSIDGIPDKKMKDYEPNEIPVLGTVCFSIEAESLDIMDECYLGEDEEVYDVEENDETSEHHIMLTETDDKNTSEDVQTEHKHHFVYDQFGRIRCTGCDETEHDYCIDEDGNGACDECDFVKDFCPNCHYAGKCICD